MRGEMKAIVALLISSFLNAGLLSAGAPHTGRVYTKLQWGVSARGSNPWDQWGWASPVSLLKGSFWAIRSESGGDVLVTARHVVEPYRSLDDVKIVSGLMLKGGALHPFNWNVHDRCIVKQLESSSVLTTLEFPIKQIGYVDSVRDVAFLQMSDSKERSITPLRLATRRPKADEAVSVIGVPGSEQNEIRSKASVNVVNDLYFTISPKVDSGCSGGVVVNDANEAYGVVSTVSEKATTVYILDPSIIGGIRWQPYQSFQLKRE